MQDRVSKLLKKSFRFIFFTGTLTTLSYSYLYYLSRQSQEAYQSSLTHPNPFPSDSFKSSDLLFMKHSCARSFSPSHITKCLIHQIYKARVESKGKTELYRQSKFDSVGVVICNKSSKRVIFYYYDQLQDVSLEEFLALPYFSEVHHSSISSKLEGIDEVAEEFRLKLHHVEEVVKQSWPIRTEGILRDSVDIVLNLWVRLGLVRPDTLAPLLRQTVGDLEFNSSRLFTEGFCSLSPLRPVKQ